MHLHIVVDYCRKTCYNPNTNPEQTIVFNEFPKEFTLNYAIEENKGDYIKANINVDVEKEAFVHGALCYCYSGQCR